MLYINVSYTSIFLCSFCVVVKTGFSALACIRIDHSVDLIVDFIRLPANYQLSSKYFCFGLNFSFPDYSNQFECISLYLISIVLI